MSCTYVSGFNYLPPRQRSSVCKAILICVQNNGTIASKCADNWHKRRMLMIPPDCVESMIFDGHTFSWVFFSLLCKVKVVRPRNLTTKLAHCQHRLVFCLLCKCFEGLHDMLKWSKCNMWLMNLQVALEYTYNENHYRIRLGVYTGFEHGQSWCMPWRRNLQESQWAMAQRWTEGMGNNFQYPRTTDVTT